MPDPKPRPDASPARSGVPDHADIMALPPLVYLGALVAGLMTQIALGGSMLSSLTLRWLFGGGFLALGMIGSAWCARRLDEAGEDRGILTPTRQVVTDGPYRWSRNPDSLSVTLSYIGLALLLDNVWMLVYLAPVLVLVHYGVILREERYLERKFGEEYCDYKSRVRRWL